jgi:hypothetical protein
MITTSELMEQVEGWAAAAKRGGEGRDATLAHAEIVQTVALVRISDTLKRIADALEAQTPR